MKGESPNTRLAVGVSLLFFSFLLFFFPTPYASKFSCACCSPASFGVSSALGVSLPLSLPLPLPLGSAAAGAVTDVDPEGGEDADAEVEAVEAEEEEVEATVTGSVSGVPSLRSALRKHDTGRIPLMPSDRITPLELRRNLTPLDMALGTST